MQTRLTYALPLLLLTQCVSDLTSFKRFSQRIEKKTRGVRGEREGCEDSRLLYKTLSNFLAFYSG